LECWQYRAICSAIELKNLNNDKFKEKYKPQNGNIHYYNDLWNRLIKKKVEFTYSDHNASSVSIVGNFKDENKNVVTYSMTKDDNDKWKIFLLLKPGTYEYNFLINDKKSTENIIKTVDDKSVLPILGDMKNIKISGTKYSTFILGGAGIGKTTLVKEILTEQYKLKSSVRKTPISIFIDGYKNFLRKLAKKKNIIFFLDEIHLESEISPYALMLDPLQDGSIYKNIENKKILYFFASSAYRTKEEFEQTAIKSNNIAMRDFATRIGHWVILPDLFQIPEQKYILAHFIAKDKDYKDSYLPRIASMVMINADLDSSRKIEQYIEEFNNEEDWENFVKKIEKYTKEKYIRGSIKCLFD